MSNIEDNRLQTTVENQSPTDIILDNDSISENQPEFSLVGRFAAVDPDTADLHSYMLVEGDGDMDNASFIISGDSLLCTEVFDYETKNSYTIRVQCMDNGEDSLMYEKIFTITINDLVEQGFRDVYATNLKIYPNPFDESTILQFNNPEGYSYELYITDLSGKVYLIIDNITNSAYVLKKGDLKEGFYFVELRGDKIFRGKIVIK